MLTEGNLKCTHGWPIFINFVRQLLNHPHQIACLIHLKSTWYWPCSIICGVSSNCAQVRLQEIYRCDLLNYAKPILYKFPICLVLLYHPLALRSSPTKLLKIIDIIYLHTSSLLTHYSTFWDLASGFHFHHTDITPYLVDALVLIKVVTIAHSLTLSLYFLCSPHTSLNVLSLCTMGGILFTPLQLVLASAQWFSHLISV